MDRSLVIDGFALRTDRPPESLLNDVVRKRSREHTLDRRRTIRSGREEFVDEAPTFFGGTVHDAFLDDVRGKLLVCQREDLTVDDRDHVRTVDRLSLLDNPLDHVLSHVE